MADIFSEEGYPIGREEGLLKDGKREGVFKYYDFMGILKKVGIFVGGEMNGLVQYFHPNGAVEQEGNMKEDKAEGLWKGYYASGKLEAEIPYKDGKIDGQFKGYYENGTLMKEGIFVGGKKEGQFNEYHENGMLMNEGTYKDGKKEGQHKGYYRSGRLRADGFFKNDYSEGVYTEYYENGQQKEEASYEDRKKVVPSKLYCVNGEMKKSVAYYEFNKGIQQCSGCGWQGAGSETAPEKMFSRLYEASCPKCHSKIAVVMYPTLQELKKDSGKTDRLSVYNVVSMVLEFEGGAILDLRTELIRKLGKRGKWIRCNKPERWLGDIQDSFCVPLEKVIAADLRSDSSIQR